MTDPACPWSWGAEPFVRRLMWEFGDGIRFRWVLGGLARSYAPAEGGEAEAAEGPAELVAEWLDVAAATGMPCDPRLWTHNPITSTYPASMAVKAAAEQGEAAATRYLRRVREALLCERRKLDHTEALVAEAGAAGLDVERFRVDLASNAIVESFGADLEEARAVPDDARAQPGKVSSSDGHERLTFPSAIFVAEGGERRGVYGRQPYDAYRDAAVAAGAAPVATERPRVLETVERFGRVATREVEELTGLPAPVARAELWSLAREWRVRAVPVLIGELWEPA